MQQNAVTEDYKGGDNIFFYYNICMMTRLKIIYRRKIHVDDLRTLMLVHVANSNLLKFRL